jgi:hypothetical protein
MGITKLGKLGFVPQCKMWDFHSFQHNVLGTTGRTSLTQGNLIMTKTVHAADGRDTAVVLATSDSQVSNTHLHRYPSCVDFRSFICIVQNTLRYFRSCRSLSSPVGNTRWKFPCSHRQMLTNVILFRNLDPGYFSWYKWRAITALLPTNPYTKCKSATSWFEYFISATRINYCTLLPLRFGHFSRLCQTETTALLMQ